MTLNESDEFTTTITPFHFKTFIFLLKKYKYQLKKMGNYIVILCDGTWNDPNSKSNIYFLYKELLERDYQRHVAYIDGIGIGELALNYILDEAVALSLGNKIKEGYKYIISHYNPGDDIWL